MRSIAFSSAGAAVALIGCVISRRPYCLLPRRGLPPLRLLRYQLLTAVAGSLAWARQLEAPRAVLVIHEFHTSQTSARKLQGNAQDLDFFVTRLTAGALRGLAVGSLVGPIRVPGDPLFDKPADLYLGKIVRRVSPPGP